MKKVIRNCVACKSVQGISFSAQPVGDLPAFCVEKDGPFAKVGIDFAGPLFIKEKKRGMGKCYIVVFLMLFDQRDTSGVSVRFEYAYISEFFLGGLHQEEVFHH